MDFVETGHPNGRHEANANATMQAAWRLDGGLSIPETVGICDLSRASAQLKAISASLARHMILNSTL